MIIQYKNRALKYFYMLITIIILNTVGIVVFNLNNNILESIITLLFFALFYAACWNYSKAKGYSGWIGIILVHLPVIGLFVLLWLSDKCKYTKYTVDDGDNNITKHCCARCGSILSNATDICHVCTTK